MSKHKWYNEIVAWAEGKEIQFRYRLSMNPKDWSNWEYKKYPAWDSDDDTVEYRIKHKHQDLIDAFNAGTKIQYFSNSWSRWEDVNNPKWSDGLEYRIKPKEDIVLDSFLEIASINLNHIVHYGDYGSMNNVRFTFDSETHELKDVKLITPSRP